MGCNPHAHRKPGGRTCSDFRQRTSASALSAWMLRRPLRDTWPCLAFLEPSATCEPHHTRNTRRVPCQAQISGKGGRWDVATGGGQVAVEAAADSGHASCQSVPTTGTKLRPEAGHPLLHWSLGVPESRNRCFATQGGPFHRTTLAISSRWAKLGQFRPKLDELGLHHDRFGRYRPTIGQHRSAAPTSMADDHHWPGLRPNSGEFASFGPESENNRRAHPQNLRDAGRRSVAGTAARSERPTARAPKRPERRFARPSD